jgi:ribonuclease G
MSDEILINVTPQETRVAVMQQGVVQEIHIERGSHRGMVSNVYVGRVKRVLPGMQSAFIDIGWDRSAFLHVADIWENSNNGEPAKPIEKVLFEGQTLLVQVIKDPIGTKGARLSTQISIAGRYWSICRKSHISAFRNASKVKMIASNCAASCNKHYRPSIAVATSSARWLKPHPTKTFVNDIAYLDKLWDKLQQQSKIQTAPALLYQELDISLRVCATSSAMKLNAC